MARRSSSRPRASRAAPRRGESTPPLPQPAARSRAHRPRSSRSRSRARNRARCRRPYAPTKSFRSSPAYQRHVTPAPTTRARAGGAVCWYLHNGMKGAGCFESVAPGEPITLTQRPTAGTVTGGEVPTELNIRQHPRPSHSLCLTSSTAPPRPTSPPRIADEPPWKDVSPEQFTWQFDCSCVPSATAALQPASPTRQPHADPPNLSRAAWLCPLRVTSRLRRRPRNRRAPM